MRHWIVRAKRADLGDRIITMPEAVAEWERLGYTVDGPFVLASTTEGPVGRLTEWADSLDFYASTSDGSPEMVRAVAVEMRAAAARGQSVERTPRPQAMSRTRAMSAECPHCGAGPGEACIGARGKPRASMHQERHEAFRGSR